MAHELTGSDLSLEKIEAILTSGEPIVLSREAIDRVERSRSIVDGLARSETPYYGINTGFGHLCQSRIGPEDLEHLQENIILSHAVGVGEPVPIDIARMMMLLKVNALARGFSGISLETLEELMELFNRGVTPVIPTQGSVGASGDLAPLAHMVLPMLGRGFVFHEGKQAPADQVLDTVGLGPVRLKSKEGLALINGTQFMAAYAVEVLIRAVRLVKTTDIVAAMSVEGLQGSASPFDERLHAIRGHPGAAVSAGNLRQLLRDSEILESHKDCPKVQDPYSLRCVPQVHGASRDAVTHVRAVVEREINAVTDNPIVFPEGDVVSGGNFHGQPLALTLDYLGIALAELASISERRTFLLLSGHDGLPKLLMEETGLNSGFMLPQYTAAALVSENKSLAHPASVDSIPTSLGFEDHVSMGSIAGRQALAILANAETVLAIELMCAAQALDYRRLARPGRGVLAAHREVRRHITHAEHDRLFHDDIRTALALIREGNVVGAAEKEIGGLQ